MVQKIAVFFFFISFIAGTLQGATTKISCSNKEYAGKSLVFYQLEDPVTNYKSEAFTLEIDSNGNCTVTVDIKNDSYYFSDFGVFRSMLLVKPGETVTLKLPPFREKTFAEEKNPYFQPVSFWFISESGANLTDKISEFEQQLNYLTDKYFNKLYLKQSKAVFDSVQTQLDILVPNTAPKSLVNHKVLQVKLTEADIFQLRPEAYSAIFNNIEPKFWLHPAFVEAMNKTFDRQLSFSAQAIHGDKVRAAVGTKNLQALIDFVETKYKTSGITTDIVLLKLLHDGFYSKEFSQQAIRNLVESPRFTKNTNALVKTTAENILDKFSFLVKGSVAPAICLNNLEGTKVCTNAGIDKFKYLVFADVETMVSKEHLKYLSRLDELFNKHLEIVVILRNAPPETVKSFFNEYKVPAQILIDKNGMFIEEYRIKSFPQCVLLDEQHRVVFDFAKAPLDGFEQQFGAYLQNELFMRQRNQNR
ncbi:redoxin domain-containing protein [Maribellus sediminis]|uniref:redoxin domain-containing protein n=1 Tax=Maribellus sediminis TaxID=2696285 RepID=UPI0014319E65|nr:redoxin domain-containing protein [Maribellus sediminis]